MDRTDTTSSKRSQVITWIECIVTMGVCSIIALVTLSASNVVRAKNEVERERGRANQIITQWLEISPYHLFSWRSTPTSQALWPDDVASANDGINGTLEVVVTNPQNGTVLTSATMPNPAIMVQIEATMTWHPHGMGSKPALRETVMTYKAL
jgi:hypothetical protein